MIRTLWLGLLTALLASPAHAQQLRIIHFSSGTGFFVNRDGYIVTNDHVVQNCRSVTVLGAVSEAPAEVIGRDEGNDLALLKTDATPTAVAELRSDYYPVEKGEEVVTVGFPGTSGLTTREATVVDPKGPTGEEKWLQFSDSVAQGNSGGPLLDRGAHVVGVVVAKAEIYATYQRSGHRELRGKSDIAISLPMVRRFLESHRVRYRQDTSGGMLASHRVEDRAKEFVVNVRCRQ